MTDRENKTSLVCRCGNQELRTSDHYRWECDKCHRVWIWWEGRWTIIAGEGTDPEYHHSNEDGLF
jgi:hypothetical protein